MKKLLITLLLISPFSFADWDDVYYCQMTNLSTIIIEGEQTDYTLEKFTFKLDKTKNAMVFGKGGYFDGAEQELREGSIFPEREVWIGGNKYSTLFFEEGKFLYSRVALDITSITANCDKF